MIVKYVGKAERIIGSSTENIERLRSQAEGVDAVFIEKAIRLISEYINLGRYSERPRILLETAAVRLAAPKTSMTAASPAGKERAAETRPAGKERPKCVPALPFLPRAGDCGKMNRTSTGREAESHEHPGRRRGIRSVP